MMKKKPRFVLVCLALLFVTGYGFTLMIESFIFFPEKGFWQRPEDYGLSYEEVHLVTKDGVKLHGWHLEPGMSKGAILFLHGNAGNISHRLFKVAPLVREEIAVLLLDYRGFGQSGGKIKKGENLYHDAESGLNWLTDKKKIKLHNIVLVGESIGSAPALYLAADNKVGGVILEAPFTTLVDLGKKHYPLVPSLLIGDFAFNNLDHVRRIKSPLLIIHGTQDEICPYAMGHQLFGAAPEPKEMLTIPRGGHNDLIHVAGKEYFEKILEFVKRNLQER